MLQPIESVNSPLDRKYSDYFHSYSPLSSKDTQSNSQTTTESVDSIRATDSLQLSSLSHFFQNNGIDIPASSQSNSQSNIQFNIQFHTSRTEKLTTSGVYSQTDKQLQAKLNYTFERNVIVDGKLQTKTYMAEFSLNVRNLQTTSAEPFQKKEDILSFIHKAIDKAMSISSNSKKSLEGVVLNASDFMEIAAIDNGQLLKIISYIFTAIMMMERMKQQLHGKENKSGVILNPKRETTSGVNYKNSNEQSFQMSMSIKEISNSVENTPQKTINPSEKAHADSLS